MFQALLRTETHEGKVGRERDGWVCDGVRACCHGWLMRNRSLARRLGGGHRSFYVISLV